MCPGGSVLESLGGLGVQVAKGAVQEAQRNRTETCAKRYAQCGLGDTCLPKHRNYCIFLTCNKNAKMGPEVGREKRYAQCHFVDMRALKRFMLDDVRLGFYNFAKPKTIHANMKSVKNHWKNE